MDKNIYSVSTHRKPPKPRSADRQATSTGTAPTAAAYDPTITPSHVASANHAATADHATTAEQSKHATTADLATTAERANAAKSAERAKQAGKADTASALQTDTYARGTRGGKIDANGAAELESLSVRGSLSVAELLINRLSAIEGDTVLTESGVIDQVEKRGHSTYRLHLRKRWDGDTHAFDAGDILRGVYNNTAAATIGQATNGVGVLTSWLRVTARANSYVDAESYTDAETPEGRNNAPLAGMRLARWGNTTNPARQGCIYLSATIGAIHQLRGVTKPILTPNNYATTWGRLPDFARALLGGGVTADDSYLYARGIVVEDLLRLDKNNALVPFKGEPGEPGKPGKDGVTPMPNLLREADLPSNPTAWKLNLDPSRVSKHEPSVVPPVTGAAVWSLFSGLGGGYAELSQEVQVIAGQSYTLSVYAKGASCGWLIGYPIGEHFALSGATLLEEGSNNAHGWRRYSLTFSASTTGKTTIILRAWHKNGRYGTVYFAAPKLEEGYTATPWAVSLQDYRGERGASARNLGEWDKLPEGFALESGKAGERYTDMVCTIEPSGAALWWVCRTSHIKSSRPSKSSPLWELGVNLNFVATDLLLAKTAVIEGNILARSMSYQIDAKTDGEIEGSMLLQDAGVHILPKLRAGEIREIRVLPVTNLTRATSAPTEIRMPNDDGGAIYTKPEQPGYAPRQQRSLQIVRETNFLTLLGVGYGNSTSWSVLVQEMRR
jgi:hypothetical protein|nr:MAG TPA: Minor structural protein 4, Minor, Lactococcus lactis, Siphoviridae, nanobody [Caudoviricetes sp.]